LTTPGDQRPGLREHAGALCFVGAAMLDVRDNVRELLSFTDRFSAQFRFAVAKALTDTVLEAQRAMPGVLDDAFEGGAVPFTRQAFFIEPARKEQLVATLGVKDRQAEYLRYQVHGGVRPPKRKALRLPGDVGLTAQGNLPAGLIAQLVRRARAGKRATRTQSQRFGVSQELDLFYGDPGDGRPPGIYKRVNKGPRQALVPVVVFPEQSARYEPRLDIGGALARVVRARLEPNIRRAWALAKATAR
jgi:hypothetical protein